MSGHAHVVVMIKEETDVTASRVTVPVVSHGRQNESLVSKGMEDHNN
jgi:hypothetical protein